MKIVTDPAKIQEILSRGVERIYPNEDFLRARLLEGKQLTLYLGIDATAPSLHLGNLIPLLKLREFQLLGHKIILLLGDFTSMIGDPTDKTASRQKLSKAEVLTNARDYRTQAARVLDFGGENPAELKYNSEWLADKNFADVLELASNLTVSQLLKRDMFQKRMAENKEIYFHELFYPMLQGYDSVAMDVDGEIGGNDQTFNMLVGRDLMKTLARKEKFVIAMKLLTDPSGKKMGKTEGNMVSLSDSRQDIFGKVMSWPDTALPLAFELLTHLSLKEIEEILERGPRDAKLELAERVTSLALGDTAEGTGARENFLALFSRHETPDDVRMLTLDKTELLQEIALREGLVSSKSDYRRLLEDGAVSLDAEPITDLKEKVRSGVLRIGKHRFLKIKVK